MAAQPPTCNSENGDTLPPAGAVAMVVAAAGSPMMESPYTATTATDAVLVEVTAAKEQGSTRPTIALSQMEETADEVVPEKPSSSNCQSCRSET